MNFNGAHKLKFSESNDRNLTFADLASVIGTRHQKAVTPVRAVNGEGK